jgi:hypothetical protein
MGLTLDAVKDKTAQLAKLRDLVEGLPPVNKATLKYLLPFLHQVTQHADRVRPFASSSARVLTGICLCER